MVFYVKAASYMNRSLLMSHDVADADLNLSNCPRGMGFVEPLLFLWQEGNS